VAAPAALAVAALAPALLHELHELASPSQLACCTALTAPPVFVVAMLTLLRVAPEPSMPPQLAGCTVVAVPASLAVAALVPTVQCVTQGAAISA